ncbi:hypothetical protein B0A52_01460 [Exophiala mesophila]|uniref:Uncharacterized protein n=1 Tax=Exophiala mesophila TaxID=212818 RepID=A0A438NF57_EXOME|nr:hypothetical protein B0A52_01460 [Exophiala mesophila]
MNATIQISRNMTTVFNISIKEISFNHQTQTFNLHTMALSNNDSNVLSALFDPEASLSRNAPIDDSLISPTESEAQTLIQSKEEQALRSINVSKPTLSNVEQSISTLTNIIQTHPSYASARVNRAQARRLIYKDEELISQPSMAQQILEDLSEAIRLVTPSTPEESISRTNARVLASAHTHRGYLLLLASKSDDNRKMLNDTVGLKSLSLQELEEAASRELASGGRYGNETARQLAVMTNPYAKLCGSIVKEALTKEISDYYQFQVPLAR